MCTSKGEPGWTKRQTGQGDPYVRSKMMADGHLMTEWRRSCMAYACGVARRGRRWLRASAGEVMNCRGWAGVLTVVYYSHLSPSPHPQSLHTSLHSSYTMLPFSSPLSAFLKRSTGWNARWRYSGEPSAPHCAQR